VDADPAARALLTDLLSGEFDLLLAGCAASALRTLAERGVDIVLADHRLPDQSGNALLERVGAVAPSSVRILMTETARLDDAVDACHFGTVHRYLFKPIKPDRLVHALRQASRAYLLERSHEQLLDELRRFNLELEHKVQQRTVELEHANRQLQQRNLMLKRMALTDPLTGLPNRRAMDRLAKTELLRRSRYPSPVAIGLIDVDHFKDVNSSHLLSGGDHALGWLGVVLAGAVRTVDTVGRVGGEEFMLVAPETDVDGAWTLAERIRKTVEGGLTVYGGSAIRLTVSLGVAVVPLGMAIGYDQIRHAAAAALGQAKREGRNRSVVRAAGAGAAQLVSG
jgi:diguanylate cyclase (GGDEF)-like protein